MSRCQVACECIQEMDEGGITFALGANAINRAMSMCSSCDDGGATTEELFGTLCTSAEAEPDAMSFEIIAACRKVHGNLDGALEAVTQMLQRIGGAGKKMSERSFGVCEGVLDACEVAQLDTAPARTELDRLRARRLVPIVTAPKVERTLAILKPDVVRRAEDVAAITALIRDEGFAVVAERRLRMTPDDASRFLRTSWGTSAGDERRRFFREMVDFYASGEVHALLLERVDAIRAWRSLLGPGDPSVARVRAMDSVRARFGTNKMANGAHGADSAAAAAREIKLLFGGGGDGGPGGLGDDVAIRRQASLE